MGSLKQWGTVKRLKWAMGASALLLGAALGYVAPTQAQQPVADGPSDAYGANDPMFREPYIDIDEWRDAPVRHRYVHGGFKDTTVKFSFYFPEKAQYQGRFFQYVSPAPGPEDTALSGAGEGNRIAFSFDSGGYLVESNMGGLKPGVKVDDIAGFRASAAAADYSRVVAMKMFGGKRPYGYIYGGSGGGYRTMAAVENTTVWDGAVPYVIGSPRGMQVMTYGHARARRVLKDKIPQIVDAIDAGGSGNMYAGLNKDEADALREVTRFGYPPRTWAFTLLTRLPGPGLPGTAVDPAYFADFWTKPGFEGSDPKSYAARHRIQFPTSVTRMLTQQEAQMAGLKAALTGEYVNPVGEDLAKRSAAAAAAASRLAGLELGKMPADDLDGAVLLVKSGEAAGQSLPIAEFKGSVVVTDPRSAALLSKIKPGDTVQIDNSDALAREVVLRYEVPSRDYVVWDQYRDSQGNPITPQTVLQPESAIAGSVQNGRFKAKVIVVASLMDETAHPWNAVWYDNKVRSQLGPKTDSQFRLWFTDNSVHGDTVQPYFDPTRTVSYLGILYQALRDVSAWVEKGVPPPASTNYQLVDGQVVVPASAAERRGVQPVVMLTANGKSRADVKPGETVKLAGVIDVPSGTGSVIKAEWDFDGKGTFPVAGQVTQLSPTRFAVSTTYKFTDPGTHFVTLRATSQRQGDPEAQWGRVRNLARARVVVK